GQLPPQGIDIMARVRSTRPPVPARLIARDGKEATVVFAAGEFGVSPGQACVFYDDGDDGARVLGGGFIAAVEPAMKSVSVLAPTPRAVTARGAPR
ncbi:MAG: aminomethyltransferase beta-barrel domain-containing protein, partial [Chloroflexota bacterium]